MGRIIAADEFPQVRKPAYLLQVDFGAELGVRKSSERGEVALCVPNQPVPLGAKLL